MSAVARSSADASVLLAELYSGLREAGCAAPGEARGQLIRPVLALAGASALAAERTPAFWSAVAAVQLAHEASLVHDDVVDEASVRRAEPTLYATSGVAAALVEGDHLLTTAYRLASASGSLEFASHFAHAVERTVAGEKLQGRAAGLQLEESAYRRIVGMKSGELLGCALAVAPLLNGAPCAAEWHVLGRRIGTLYQMLDDLLDYCPGSETGKPALADYRQRRWTWPLLEARGLSFGLPTGEVSRLFAARDARGSSPLRRCLDRFNDESLHVRASLAAAMPEDAIIGELIAQWVERAASAVAAVELATARADARAVLRQRLALVPDAERYFRQHSRSFSFAARAFPPAVRRQVAELYAFCRFTDDLADGDGDLPAEDRLAALDEWERLARASYDGEPADIPLLDRAMASAAAAGVPFAYAAELIEGMRMDLRSTSYETPAQLRLYSYRVAGVVGQWLTRMCGVHDDAVLERAARLGHAMQLTNILRDVGEDLRAGRLYLPASTLREHDVDADALRAGAAGAPLPVGYAHMLEHLMAVADRDYTAALEAVHALPHGVRRAVVVAAHVYRGIHDRIRANGYDNVRHRAHTGMSTKLLLALRALTTNPGDAAPAPRTARVRRTIADTAVVVLLALAAGAALVHGATPSVEPAGAVLAAAGTHSLPLPTDTVTPAAHLAMLEAEFEAAPGDTSVALDLLRALYFAAVDDEAALRRGHAHAADLDEGRPALGEARRPLLAAYRGALIVLDAKHGSWPPARLRAVRDGLRYLDQAVAAAPDDIEVRYLRLVSTHYLPGLFGRRESARADLRAVAGLLPTAMGVLPPELFHVVTAFVREHGAG